MSARLPHLMLQPGTNRRLTLLDCGVCGSLGHFTITRVGKVFACPRCEPLALPIGRSLDVAA